ncbi:hypothetical protein E8E11_003274 [Didymella keratinophila]|nr:hypothetical protein E8E11_003274 [Didymella keratinophila]
MNFDYASWRQMWRPSNDERKLNILPGGERPIDAVTLIFDSQNAKMFKDALSHPQDRSQWIMARAGPRDARLVSPSERKTLQVGLLPPPRSFRNTTNTTTYAPLLSTPYPLNFIMHQLISHFGLSFDLFELQGTLTYEHTRSGRPPKSYEISESDIEDTSDNDATASDTVAPVKPGIDVNAGGIRLCLLKNDGHLQMKFQGRDGNSAEWHFDGMSTEKVSSSAGTQTPIDIDECVLCGHEATLPSETRDSAVQTDVATVHEVTFSAEAGSQTTSQHEAKVEVIAVAKSEQDRTTRKIPNPTNDGSCQTDLSVSSKFALDITTDSLAKPTTTLKRKASPTPQVSKAVHKRAKSTQSSRPWPSTTYMTCQREHPVRKGDIGQLIIDIAGGSVWYEDTHGKPGPLTQERKQVDFSHDSARVSYQRNAPPYITTSRHGPTHNLRIERRKKDGGMMPLAEFSCAAPKWKTWYEDAHVGRCYINDAEVVVDAIVHCIDRASGRKAVHNPEKDHALEQEEQPDQRPQLLADRRKEKERDKVYKPRSKATASMSPEAQRKLLGGFAATVL